jgi:hypothetical protein
MAKRVMAVALVLTLLGSVPVLAQEQSGLDQLRKEIQALRTEVQALRKDMEAERGRPGMPAPMMGAPSGSFTMGPPWIEGTMANQMMRHMMPMKMPMMGFMPPFQQKQQAPMPQPQRQQEEPRAPEASGMRGM